MIGLQLVMGCGGKTDSQSAHDGTTDSTTGGIGSGSGGAISPAKGGTTSVEPQNGGAATVASGGTTSTGKGGATGTASGGVTIAIAAGGTKADSSGGTGAAAGGKLATGGTSTVTAAGKASIGGSLGGVGANGGEPGRGGAATGGMNSAGMGAAGTGIGTAGSAGAALAAFCSGSINMVAYQGQVLSPSATSFESLTPLSCCMTYGIALHSSPQLGFDLQLTVIEYGMSTRAAGDYAVADNSTSASPFRVSIAKLGDNAALFTSMTAGSLRLIGNPPMTSPWAMGVCLQVNDLASPFAGTRVYVPQVAMSTYGDFKRLQIYRLADATLTPSQAASSQLATLALAATPWLSLSGIVSVERSTGVVELSTGYKSGETLRSALSDVTLTGAPFIVTADGIPIYLGTFFRSISSMSPVGPVIMVDEISSGQFQISPPMQGGSDPRFDSRIVQVLTETGRIVP